jgi:hypothetical protein
MLPVNLRNEKNRHKFKKLIHNYLSQTRNIEDLYTQSL